MLWLRLKNRLRRWVSTSTVPIWYHPAYRLPSASIEGVTHFDPRRADLVRHFLLDSGVASGRTLRAPSRIRYGDLARVHSDALLQSLHDAERLADVFALDPSDIHVDEILRTVRLACGGTLEAARASLERRGATLNLLGGFHHAGPDRAAGLCPVNDIAVAVAALRHGGLADPVAVLDLDAHPPDGTAECLAGDAAVWLGSLSSSHWDVPDGVDETVLARGSDEAQYLAALDALLGRMPRVALAFVVAGGDVLVDDRAGGLRLSLSAAQQRDLAVLRALREVPSVWLPGGGYSRDAWKVLAGTALVLSQNRVVPVPSGYDSLGRYYASIGGNLRVEELTGGEEPTERDVMADLGYAKPKHTRLLGFYTAEGIEYALFRYGVLDHLARLGYQQPRVVVDQTGAGDRMRLFATTAATEHLVIECVVEQQTLHGESVLYVRWLTLRDARGRFGGQRPDLPGQEEPGLGLAREAGHLLARAALRLGLAGVAFRPAWLHTAHMARRAQMRFVDPTRQGRYEALLRDLAEVPLLEATRAMAEHRVLLDGKPYSWEADEMVYWIDERPYDDESMRGERDRVRFSWVPPAGS
jgi:acetoin utilization deacetylase AcuC-like enzyme